MRIHASKPAACEQAQSMGFWRRWQKSRKKVHRSCRNCLLLTATAARVRAFTSQGECEKEHTSVSARQLSGLQINRPTALSRLAAVLSLGRT